MNTQQPPRCHHDRHLGERVTRQHTDPCRHPNPDACDGCAPCLHPHCSVCGREHCDDAHPNTCPACVSSIREDLDEIARHTNGLTAQAIDAASDGHLWAAAPIPGALATVLAGPGIRPGDVIRDRRHYVVDHLRSDPMPPLVVLAHAEDVWRTWLGQASRRTAGVQASVDYLDAQLTRIAQTGPRLEGGRVVAPPEFPEFARTIGRLRAQLEHALHDEQEPDRGVECFECGHRLVRRHRDPRRCHHATPAREAFAERLFAQPAAVERLALLASYGLRPTGAECAAALPPSPTMVAAARAPCPRCDQGGLVDPSPGVSWECPCCRKVYTPGEYATAVRRDLLDSEEGAGWSTFPVAASAASDITGKLISVTTIRTWITRGDDVAVVCDWSSGARFTRQLVFWPDVARRASETRQRGRTGHVA